MRLILPIFCLLLCASATAQRLSDNPTKPGWKFYSLVARDALGVPRYPSTSHLPAWSKAPWAGTTGADSSLGLLAYTTADSTLHYYTGTQWLPLRRQTADTCLRSLTIYRGQYLDTLQFISCAGDTTNYYADVKTGLLEGGIVTYAGLERTYDISAGKIRPPFSDPVSIPETRVTLSAVTAGQERIDVFVYNADGTAGVVQGTEGAVGIEPYVDPATQVKLAIATLSDARPSGVDTTIISDELTNWTGTSSGLGSINFTGTANPYRGTYAVDVGAINSGDLITFTNASTLSNGSYSGLALYLRLKQAMPNNNNIYVSFYNGATPVTNEVALSINKSNLAYQGLGISLAAFNWSNTLFDRIRFRYNGSGISGLYLDFVYLQNGIAPVVIGTDFVQHIGRTGNDVWEQINGVTINRFSLADKLNVSDTASMLANYITNEADPVFNASAAAGIVGGDITNWNSAYSWGNHASAGYVPQSRTINGLDLTTDRTLTTTNIAEGTNLYYTDARARAAISLTTTGTSGAATYNSSTGVLNVPQYSGGGGGGVTTVGAFSASAQTNGASISGSTITFGPGSATIPGMVSTGAQVFAGDKRFQNAVQTTGVGDGLSTGLLVKWDNAHGVGNMGIGRSQPNSGFSRFDFFTTNLNSVNNQFRWYAGGSIADNPGTKLWMTLDSSKLQFYNQVGLTLSSALKWSDIGDNVLRPRIYIMDAGAANRHGIAHYRLYFNTDRFDFFTKHVGGTNGFRFYGDGDATLTPSYLYLVINAEGVKAAYPFTTGSTGTIPASAQLEAVNLTKGVLLTNKTSAQRNSISSPATGLLTTNTTDKTFDIYDGTRWNNMPNGLKTSAALNFPSIAAGATSTLTITLSGAADGDMLYIGIPNASMTAGLVFNYWVSAADTISIQAFNSTAAAIDPASGTFKVYVIKN